MTKIKKSFTALMVMFGLTCVGGLVSTQTALAENATTNENTQFSLVKGASIRLNADHYGIRYSALVGEVLPNVQYKMMIIPTSYLEKYDSQIKAENNDYYKAISNALKAEQGDNYYLAVMNCNPTINTDGNYYIKGSLTNLKYGNLNRSFDGFAFYTDSQGNNVYANKTDNVRNIVSVASKAIVSGDYQEGTDEYTILNKIITNGINAFNKVSVDKKDDPINLQLNKDNLTFDKIGNTETLSIVGLPNSIDILWSSENEDIVTVTNGVVKATGEGTTKVNAKVLNKDYTCNVTVNNPIKDYTKAASVGDLVKYGGIGDNNSITFKNINSIIKEEDLTKDKITKVLLNNKEVKTTINNDKITIDKNIVPNNLNGYVNIEFHTNTNIYKMNVMIVRANISNVTEFTQFFQNVPADYCKGETAILSQDIDCTTYKAQNNQQGGGASSFSGTLDGRGHAIKNISVGLSNNRRALFRIVNTGATIKNIAFIDSKVGFSTAYYPALIASELYGTIENCFVSGTNQTKNNGANVNVAGGIANQINNKSVVRNCISVVEFSGTAENNALIVADNRTERTGKSFSNCYGISKTATKMVGNEKDFNIKNLQAFTNVTDFGQNVANGLEGEGWAEYWRIDGTKLYFGNNIVLDWTK